MRKIRDVLRLSAEGLSTRHIAASLAIGRTTLRGYLDRATEVGLSWPLPPEMSDTDLERLIYPRTSRDILSRAAPPDWAHIHRELRRKGVTLSLLWEEYRADHLEGYGDGRFPRLFRSITKAQLLILDDWGPERLTATQRRDLMEIVEERYGRGATMITSQLPINTWHDVIGDPTFADAILDRIVHNAYRLELEGQSMRKIVAKMDDETPQT
jgi:hypothetical protein